MKVSNTQKKSLGRFAPVAVMLAVLAVTAPATIAFAGRIFPDSIIRQIALIVVTEFAFMAWHLTANGHARGDRQHSVSELMTWVSLGGVVLMAGVEIAIEFSKAKLIAESNIFGMVGLVVLIGLMAAHLSAAVYYAHSDPDRLMRAAAERADALIAETILEATEAEAQNIAGEIAAFQQAAANPANYVLNSTLSGNTPVPFQACSPAALEAQFGRDSEERLDCVVDPRRYEVPGVVRAFGSPVAQITTTVLSTINAGTIITDGTNRAAHKSIFTLFF